MMVRFGTLLPKPAQISCTEVMLKSIDSIEQRQLTLESHCTMSNFPIMSKNYDIFLPSDFWVNKKNLVRIHDDFWGMFLLTIFKCVQNFYSLEEKTAFWYEAVPWKFISSVLNMRWTLISIWSRFKFMLNHI